MFHKLYYNIIKIQYKYNKYYRIYYIISLYKYSFVSLSFKIIVKILFATFEIYMIKRIINK